MNLTYQKDQNFDNENKQYMVHNHLCLYMHFSAILSIYTYLHTHACHSLHILRSQMSFTIFFALSQGNIQRFRYNNSPIHFSYCFSCFFWRAEADKAKSLGTPITVSHDLKRKNHSKDLFLHVQSFKFYLWKYKLHKLYSNINNYT